MLLQNGQSLLQFFKFVIVGVSNTLVSLAVYYLFLWINPQLYLLGNVIGCMVSVANAFFWNNKYVFQDKTASRMASLKKLGKTYLAYGATFLISTGLLYLEVDVLHCSAILGPLINLFVTVPLNFLLNKFWAFR